MAGTIYGSKLQGMRAAVGDTLAELGRKNEKIVILGIVLITAMSLNDWCVAPTLAAVIPA